MRTFYLFEIKEDLKQMLKKTPYELYRTLETIYYETNEVEVSFLFLKQLITPISIKQLDVALFKRFKDNYFYKTYLKLETNVIKPRFLEELQKNHNLFVCDFAEKDYFWLDSLEPMVIG